MEAFPSMKTKYGILFHFDTTVLLIAKHIGTEYHLQAANNIKWGKYVFNVVTPCGENHAWLSLPNPCMLAQCVTYTSSFNLAHGNQLVKTGTIIDFW